MKIWCALCACVLAAGCSSPNTAMELLREQQQAQMALQAQEARQQARQAAGEDQVYLTSIRRMQDEGRHFAALAHLEAYDQRYGRSAEAALMRADALRATGQRAASEAAYRALLGQTQSAAAWRGLGLLAGGAGDFATAARDLARAAALAPTDVNVLNDLGYARLRAGQPREARVPLAQAAELAPDNLKVIANLALLLAVEGEAERADAVMARAGLSEDARAAVREQAQMLRRPAPGVAGPVDQQAGAHAVHAPEHTVSTSAAVAPVTQASPPAVAVSAPVPAPPQADAAASAESAPPSGAGPRMAAPAATLADSRPVAAAAPARPVVRDAGAAAMSAPATPAAAMPVSDTAAGAPVWTSGPMLSLFDRFVPTP